MKNWRIETYTGNLNTEQQERVKELIDTLRLQDRKEISCYANDVAEEIIQTQKMSEACYMVLGGIKETHPLVFYGRIKHESFDERVIWCVGTKYLEPFTRDFAAVSRRILGGWVRKYRMLFNAVAEFNTPAIRWLEWCGAEFGDEFEQGGEKFIRFWIRERRNGECVLSQQASQEL